MLKWLFHILIFATSCGKYQNKEKPLNRQRKLGLGLHKMCQCSNRCMYARFSYDAVLIDLKRLLNWGGEVTYAYILSIH